MLSIRLAGEDAVLHPTGALFLPAPGTLLVADAHFGKAVSFRRLGVPAPRGTTSGTLARLDAALAATGARRVIFLGDFLHSVRAQGAGTQEALQAWRRSRPELALQLEAEGYDKYLPQAA